MFNQKFITELRKFIFKLIAVLVVGAVFKLILPSRCAEERELDDIVKKTFHDVVDTVYIDRKYSSLRRIESRKAPGFERQEVLTFGDSWGKDHIFYMFSVGDSVAKKKGEKLVYIYEDINDPEGMHRFTSTHKNYQLKHVIDLDTVLFCIEEGM